MSRVSAILVLQIIIASISGCLDSSKDLDGDGISDEIDEDKDGDGWKNSDEMMCGTDEMNRSSTPKDKDKDGVCNELDPDLDGLLDGWRNSSRPFALRTEDPEWYGMNITTWQMENGGWRKNNMDGYMMPWEGEPIPATSSYFANLSTMADRGTVKEIRFLSNLYSSSTNESNRSAFKVAVERGIEFVLESQHESGGWPQVYPEHSGPEYHKLMTYNDHVIVSGMLLLMDINSRKKPFDTDIVENINFSRVDEAMEKGMEYILASQVIVDGDLTIWGQQHDPYTFQTMPARSYELAGRTGLESAGVVAVLLNWEDRDERVVNATWAGIDWYEENVVFDLVFENGEFSLSPGSMLWYRFYNTSDDQHFFSGRDGVKVFDFDELEHGMATSGYTWAGNWAEKIIRETAKIPFSERG
jgi:PelA/Pel-15E family pectate lyase